MAKSVLSGVLLLFFLVLSSCNAPDELSSYGREKRYTRVSVNLGSVKEPRQALQRRQTHFAPVPPTINRSRTPALSTLPELMKTALVIAVDEGTVFTEDYWEVSAYYDQQLVDLSTASATLTLPLDTPLELFEYTFNQPLTLSELSEENHFVYSRSVLGPFTVNGDTEQIRLTAALKQALDASFTYLLNNRSYVIEIHHRQGVIDYVYVAVNWKNMSGERYRFDSKTRTFQQVTESEITGYDLVDGEWVPSTHGPPAATFASADDDTYTVYYSSPDFSATLIDVVDLAVEGISDGDEEGFLSLDSYSRGSRAYVMAIEDLFSNTYHLEDVEQSHDCERKTFTSLAEFIEYNSLSAQNSYTAFACKGYDGSACLAFDGYESGKTSGNIYEITRDNVTYQVIGTEKAGTWQIKTVSGKEMLFYYPDSTDYYQQHDNETWSDFWHVYQGQVWRGYYQVVAGSGADTKMEVAIFNESALRDIEAYLQTAPESIFISEYDGEEGDGYDGTCYDGSDATGDDMGDDMDADTGDSGTTASQKWGEAVWGQFEWGP